MSEHYQHVETAAIHGGQSPEPTTGAVMPPIFQTSTYAQPAPGEHKGYEYSRTDNPTRNTLERNLAALEGGAFGLAFASGLAAITTVMATLSAGDHVVASDDLYGGTVRLFDRVMANLGLTFSYVDLSGEGAEARLRSAMSETTKMIWVETPSNPLLKLIDLTMVATVAQEAGVISVCDNTFLSPYLQQPLRHGIDMVMHSTTKYLNGHSDVVGGALILNDEALHGQLKFLQNAMGGVPGPMDSWLVMRGIKTLAVRMERHQENALKIAQWLDDHPDVERVVYPGLESHPQYELAQRQQLGPGGMITIFLKGGLEESRRFLGEVKLFTLAESLGGVESLIEHPAIMTHASLPAERRAELGISDTLVRLSVGLEHVDDLIADLGQALAAL
ncbi:MAG: cystathionine gamma-synthase [Anaerolineales bacterium]|nr:cystathionine gamma-synthase [Anaerolineales bacterium]MCB9126877.1 cystathionine gamma-synthase [Ardenticatenales bacterium]